MYIVDKENALGYVVGGRLGSFVRMVVVAVDYMRGGDPLLIGRSTLASDYREATEEDARRFGWLF